MLKKWSPSLVALLAPALLTGCPVYVDTYGSYTTYGSPDVVVVGAHVPTYIEYDQPKFTQGSGVDNPIIDSFTQNIAEVKPGQPITFTVVAHDPNKKQLQFNWSSTGGTLSTNTGRVVSWDPPDNAGIYTVSVVIANGDGGVATGSLNLTVRSTPASPKASDAPLPTPKPTVDPTPAPTATPVPTPGPSATPTPAPTPAAGTATVAGVVKDDAGPLEGAEVLLTSGDPKVAYSESFTTQADGAYKFTNVPAGTRLVISARKSGYGEKLYAFTATAGKETSWSFEGTYALPRL